MKVCIITLGCKVNTYESEIITENFKNRNYSIIDNYKISDIVIVNTCSVTNTANNKSKKIIRDIRRDNPNAILVVCGCMAQQEQNNLDDLNIDILIGNKDKSKILELVEEYLKTKVKYTNFVDVQTIPFEDMSVSKFSDHTRAFLKIQDGCNNYCSYCIIPYLRGALRCKKFDKAIEEAEALVESGHQEIVLTGIHTGTYTDEGKDLVDLINEMSKIEGLNRIRVSSIEVLEITDKFLEMLKNNPKVCSHMHIPLQSGSDTILNLMNRRYKTNKYEEIINKIRTVRPDISISCDLIVGFPGESEELFNETYEFCQRINFSKIHVFPFSLRKGTKAEELPNHIDNSIKKQRVHKILELSQTQEEAYNKQFLGKTLEVLIEKAGQEYSLGHTSNYINVKVLGNVESNKIYKVKIIKVCQNNVYGQLI